MFCFKKKQKEVVKEIINYNPTYGQALLIDGKIYVVKEGDRLSVPSHALAENYYILSFNRIHTFRWNKDAEVVLCKDGTVLLGIIVHYRIKDIPTTLSLFSHSRDKIGRVSLETDDLAAVVAHNSREWCYRHEKSYVLENRTELGQYIKGYLNAVIKSQYNECIEIVDVYIVGTGEKSTPKKE